MSVRYQNRWLQLAQSRPGAPAQDKVLVCEGRDTRCHLSSNTRDVASAEDALSNALVATLTTWPRDGVPQNPDAWLLTAARHSFIDHVRHRQVAEASEPTLLLLREQSQEMTLAPEFPG